MRKLLIVDDEILVRVGLRSITDWEAHGYTIAGEAADGAEALALIRKAPPDIVLTDLRMDGMDGFGLIEACRDAFPQVRFIVLSSYNDFENVKRAMKLGAVDYVFKLTAKPSELLKILDEIPPVRPQDPSQELLVRKNLPAIKESLILSAAQKSYLHADSLEEKFGEIGLCTDFEQPYRVMYFRNDSLPALVARGDVPETQLIKYSMGNIIQEVLSGCCDAETYSFTGNDVLSVLAAQAEPSAREQALSDAFAQIHEYIKRYLGMETTASLSNVFCGLDQFSGAVLSCQKTLSRQAAAPQGVLLLHRGDCRPEIEQIKQQVKANIRESLTVPQAAALCNMSESYFAHLFKKEVGISFVDYINLCKVEQAQELLLHTELRISEIGEQVGVLNPNYFSVLFKKITGCSPQDYRKGE